jgi:predicted type IV restriction endonuclease
VTESPDVPTWSAAGAAVPAEADLTPDPADALGAVTPNGQAPAGDLDGSKASTSPEVTVPKAPRAAPKWETEARDRVKAAVRRFQKPLADLLARDANEGDTRLLVTDFLCDGLGFDKYEDLTTEYQVKGEFADYGVRVDKQLMAFIEVKRVAQKLNEKHLRQVQSYAVNEGVEWMILTNGQVWQVWHMTPGLPVTMDKALEVDLLSDESVAVKANALFYLSRDALKRHQIDELWKAQAATSPKSLAKVLLSDKVIEEIRKELRRQTGHNADADKVTAVLRAEVIRPEVL